MVSRRPLPARIVLGAGPPPPGAAAGDAALCRPGVLDAGAVADAVVVCERGGIGRLDKSAPSPRPTGSGWC